MSLMTAVSAFTHRNARRGAVWQLLLYSGGLTALILILCAWFITQTDGPPGGACYWDHCVQLPTMGWSVLALGDVVALSALALGLFVLAPAMVAAAVAAERRAGTLDQLRTTPLSPLGLLAGILVGTPARLYLLLAGPLALHVMCGITGVIPIDSLLSSLCVLATGGLASVMVGLAVALAPRQETGGALVALGVAALLCIGAFATGGAATDGHGVGWSFLHPGGALSASFLQHDTLWRRLNLSLWRYPLDEGYVTQLGLTPLLSCLSSLSLAAVLGAACCRKLAAPHLPLLSKPQAIALFAGLASSAVFPLYYAAEHFGESSHDLNVALLLAMLLMPVLAILGVFTTPSFEAWALSLRRKKRLGFLHDDAAPHRAMWLMVLIFGALIAASMYGYPVEHARTKIALGWTLAMAMALTLPIYVHFVATRYSSTAARWGFGVAILAHLICQAIAIVMIVDRERYLDHSFVHIAALAGVVVPAWVALRQHALRRRTLAAG